MLIEADIPLRFLRLKKRFCYRGMLRKRACLIALLILDCDGVLTDGMLPRRFNIYDGLGIKRLVKTGINVMFISGSVNAEDIHLRAKDLGIKSCYTGIQNKEEAFKNLLIEKGIQSNQVAYMGDDINDLGAIRLAGFSVAPKNAVKEVLKKVHYITKREGGHGAVREICDLLCQYHDQSKNIKKDI